MKFLWDENKAASNLKKHEISFHEATTVFGDPLSITIDDPDHSDNEHRFITIGFSTKSRILVVIHSDQGDNIRIISARSATRGEIKNYEEGF